MHPKKETPKQSKFGLLKQDLGTLGQLVFSSENLVGEIAFFATQSQYYSYYQGLLEGLTARKHNITYLTCDPEDINFFQDNPQIHPNYSKSLLPLTFPLLTSPLLVTTVPDIHQYQIKRSFAGTNYVYVFHAMVSTHMMYRKGAFDYYDTIFCVGPHHAEEIRKTEKIYDLPEKQLYEVGYYRLEKIHNQHKAYLLGKKQATNQPLILIAPGWQSENIIDTCANELIATLLKNDFQVVLRPHPMTIAHQPEKIDAIQKQFNSENNFKIDTQTSSEHYLHLADIMVCDWSGVALEYAFGTERPVLFIDLPPKVYNPEYQKLGVFPLEVSLRNQIGKTIQPGEVSNAGKIILDFLNRKDEYLEQIVAARSNSVFNFGHSSKIGTEIIEKIKKTGTQGSIHPF
jgi:YidC/Oxa1 family membrane protein insertase